MGVEAAAGDAMSRTESEFSSVSQCAVDSRRVYLRRILELLGFKHEGPTPIGQDNYACVCLTGTV